MGQQRPLGQRSDDDFAHFLLQHQSNNDKKMTAETNLPRQMTAKRLKKVIRTYKISARGKKQPQRDVK